VTQTGKLMRIVICDYSGHPFQIELSRHLAARGHTVLHLHFAEFQTPKGAVTVQAEDAPTFAVEAVSLGQSFAKDKFLRRRFQELRIGTLIAERALSFGPDIVVGCNMPLDAQRQLQQACVRAGIAFVFWLQDIYSAAIGHYLGERLGLPGRLIANRYRRLERSLLSASDAVVAISDRFLPTLADWRIPDNRITVIPNWASLSEIYPMGKDNDWARLHRLHDKTVALYTGTLGLKHNPAILLDLARAGAAQALQVVVLSEGKAAQWLEQAVRHNQLDNLTILPFQPMALYPQILGAGDILLAILGAEAASFSVPSKILSYLAAGKPTVAAMASDNDAAKIILGIEAGFVASPDDSSTFTAQALALAADPIKRREMGDNGRAFAERNFAIDDIADRFETVFAAALARRQGAL
jgi:glycosyltransferase involved in cell wall biosynthesis